MAAHQPLRPGLEHSLVSWTPSGLGFFDGGDLELRIVDKGPELRKFVAPEARIMH